jgi:hypothetical protein
MTTKLPLFSLLLAFCANVAGAMPLPKNPNCDTIFAKNGKTYIVQIVDQDAETIEYYPCDNDLVAYTIRQDEVARIGYTEQTLTDMERTAYRKDPIGKAAYTALVLVLLGSIGGMLLGTFSFLALPLMVWGVIRGERALQKLRKNPGHRFEKKARKQARMAVIWGQATLILGMLLYLLINLAFG